MFTKFLKFVSFFDSVDSVIADIEKKIKRLENVEETHAHQARVIRETIFDLEEEEGFHSAEAKRASAVAKKFKALVNA